MPGIIETTISPFDGLDVFTMLRRRAEERGEHPFLVWRPFVDAPRTWSYREFCAQAERIAAGLARHGVTRSDRVLIHLANCPEALLTWFACARIGAVAVSTNARLSPEELSYVAGKVAPRLTVTQSDMAAMVREAAPDAAMFFIVPVDGEKSVPSELLDGAARPFAELSLDPSDLPDVADLTMAPLGIQFTSGTTSRPKGVVFTHSNALWAAKVGAAHMRLIPSDISLEYLPLFHIVGFSWISLATFWVGGTIVLQPRFSAGRFWQVSMECRCTFTVMMRFCLIAFKTQKIPQHYYRLWNNGAWDESLIRDYGVDLVSAWGMTEVVSEGIVGDSAMPPANGSMGRPAVEYDVVVVDDDDVPVGPGQTGHLLIRAQRGIGLFLEYYKDPEATARAFTPDGFFRTGDIVMRLPDGSLRYWDRFKDMLKVGGENVAASEIERVIGKVEGVVEVAVVGKPDDFLAEVPAAFVLVAEPPEPSHAEHLIASVHAACARELADFKRPREVRVVLELPRGVNGKILKRELRQVLAEPTGSVS